MLRAVGIVMTDSGWQPEMADPLGRARLAEANGSSPLRYSDEEIAETLSRSDQLRAAVINSYGLDDLPAPEALIDGILYKDTLAWLHGKPGCGKSFVALDWAGCVSVGLPWQGRPVTVGPVLYVIAEGVTGLRQRVRAWEDHAGGRTMAAFLPVAVQFLDAIDFHALTGIARDLRPVLIVIDTQARVTVGADENSARDMGTFVAAADKLRQATDACVLFVHHESRSGENMRGSTALEGAAATLIRITKDGSQLRAENVKQKDTAPFDPIRMRLVPRLDSAVVYSHDGLGVTPELAASEQKILDTLRESFGSNGAPASRLLRASALPESSFYRALKRLADLGEVVNLGNKKRTLYVLAEHDAQDVLPSTPNDCHGSTTALTPNSHTPLGVGVSGSSSSSET